MTTPLGPGQLYLIDTSAHARINHLPIRNIIAGLLADWTAATCMTVDLPGWVITVSSRIRPLSDPNFDETAITGGSAAI